MGHILKHDSVQVEGAYSLAETETTAGSPDSETQRVRVVEQQDDYSIIEVVCACGETLRIRCEHPV